MSQLWPNICFLVVIQVSTRNAPSVCFNIWPEWIFGVLVIVFAQRAKMAARLLHIILLLIIGFVALQSSYFKPVNASLYSESSHCGKQFLFL